MDHRYRFPRSRQSPKHCCYGIVQIVLLTWLWIQLLWLYKGGNSWTLPLQFLQWEIMVDYTNFSWFWQPFRHRNRTKSSSFWWCSLLFWDSSVVPFVPRRAVNSCVSLQVGSPVSTVSSFSVGSNVEEFKEDPFKNKDPFGGANALASSQADPFQNDDPFRDSEYIPANYL